MCGNLFCNRYSFSLGLFNLMCMNVLHLAKRSYTCVLVAGVVTENTESPGTRVRMAGMLESPCRCWESNPGPL